MFTVHVYSNNRFSEIPGFFLESIGGWILVLVDRAHKIKIHTEGGGTDILKAGTYDQFGTVER